MTTKMNATAEDPVDEDALWASGAISLLPTPKTEPAEPAQESVTPDFTVYGQGVFCASVCTSLPLEEATRRMNAENPSGTENGWNKSEDVTFRCGEPNPCTCPDHPATHKHYLFEV
jgi:hypothetical protein